MLLRLLCVDINDAVACVGLTMEMINSMFFKEVNFFYCFKLMEVN